jgi:hypothetical protein
MATATTFAWDGGMPGSPRMRAMLSRPGAPGTLLSLLAQPAI